MDTAELKKLLQQQNEAFEEFKKANDDQLQQIRQEGSASAEKVAKVEQISDTLDDLQSRISEAETQLAMPRHNTPDDRRNLSPEQQEQKDAFLNFLRKPKSAEAQDRYQNATAQVKMEVSVGTAAAGGYALPEVIDRTIGEKIVDVSPMRGIVTVRQSSTTDYKELVNVHGGGYAWVGEGDTRSEQGTPQLAEVAPTFGTIQSYFFATEESLNDLFFDVETFLMNEAALQHAKGEGIAIINGNGTNRPTGFLDGTPVATADEGASPERAFGTLEYKPTGNASGFGVLSTGSPLFYPADVIYGTIYALKAGYRNNARWLTNKATLGVLRKLKDNDGGYLWQPSVMAGQPSMLAGYPVTEAEDMPDIGANAFPVAFGDFREGYVLVDLVGTRVTIDPYTTPGKVKFYIRRRVGGKLRNDDAIKLIKCATS